MNYSQAVSFVESLINYERTARWPYPEAVKLDRMASLASALGNPQNRFESVLIAGSKGKGSTAACLESILRMADLRVGLYTSPHLEDIRERIRVNGQAVSEDRFARSAQRVKKILESPSLKMNPPTYFECLTAMAFDCFHERKVDVAVLEVGLGGLYDSTNLAPAKVAGITPIFLEHADKLGKTAGEIAVQKCGILKGHETLVASSQTAEVRSVIEKSASEKKAACLRVGRDIRIHERAYGEDFQKFDLTGVCGDFPGLETRLRGTHQIENAALAVGLAKSLERRTRFRIPDAAVRNGLLEARWPGRLERICREPLTVLDGAHHPDSVRKALEGLRRHFSFDRIIAVLAVSSDKDYKGILEVLRPEVSAWVVTRFKNPRSIETWKLADALAAHGIQPGIEEDSEAALSRAWELAGPRDLIFVTGSLLLAGEIRSLWGRFEERHAARV